MTTPIHATPAHCARCGRSLESAKSRAAGYGPTCARKVRAELRAIDLTVYKPAQIKKATRLVDDRAIVRDGAAFVVVASNGVDRYRVTPYTQTCTCQAGRNGRRCYHLIAATAVAAA